MFDTYKSIHQPRSIEDVVDKIILQNLMQAFYYREGTGMTMLYDKVGAQSNAEGLLLHRLHPFPEDPSSSSATRRHGYSEFCRELRQDSTLDLACRRCDESHAQRVLRSNDTEPKRYGCHMGLDDMLYPIKVGQKVRAILFAGQRLPHWDVSRMEYVKNQIKIKVPPMKVAPLSAHLEINELQEIEEARKEAESLWQAFIAFGKTVQHTVDSFYKAKLTLAHQEAELEVNARINAGLTNTSEPVSHPITEILDELTRLGGMGQLVFMMRRASRYVSVAISQGLYKARDLHIPVHEVIPFTAEKWAVVDDDESSPRLREVRQRYFRFQPLSLYRVDAVNQDARALSALLIVQGRVPAEQEDLLADCMRAMASTAHVHALIEQMQQQQDNLATTVTFAGHTMKTPISVALLSLNKIYRYARGEGVERSEVGLAVDKITERLQEVLLDAWQFQAAAKAKPVRCDLVAVMEGVLQSLEESAAKEHIRCSIYNELRGNPRVLAIEARLRVGLRNLLDNAIKYSFKGKEVRVYLRWLAQRQMIITITNYGVGIDPTKVGELFTSGARVQIRDMVRRRTGAGLGLVQSKSYIEECGGSLDLESKRLPSDNPNSPRSLITATITLPTQI